MKLSRILLALIASAVVGCQSDTPMAPAQPEPQFDLTLDGARIDLTRAFLSYLDARSLPY